MTRKEFAKMCESAVTEPWAFQSSWEKYLSDKDKDDERAALAFQTTCPDHPNKNMRWLHRRLESHIIGGDFHNLPERCIRLDDGEIAFSGPKE
jgi:hypothetical protein